jgi:hypothetical protein
VPSAAQESAPAFLARRPANQTTTDFVNGLLGEDRALSTEEAARQCACVVLIDYDDPVNHHHFDTFRVLVWVVKGGAVSNRLGVEENEIGGIALYDCAAVRKAKCSGCAAGHLVDSLR